MTSSINPTIVIAIAGAAALFGITIVVLKYLKGSLTIMIRKPALRAGEKLEGKVRVELKQNVEGNELKAFLICKEVTYYYTRGRRRTQRREIYRDERILEGSKAFPKGFRKEYDFEFNIPALTDFSGSSEPSIQLGVFGLRIGSNAKRHEWAVTCVLDAAGVDLNAERKLLIQ